MRRRTLSGIVSAGAGAGAGAVAVVAFVAFVAHRGAPTTYAMVSAEAGAVFLIAGLGLLLAGGVAALDAATGALPALCVLSSVAWLSSELAGWETGPPLLRSAGVVLVPFLAPALAHLALVVPAGHLRGSPGRAAITVAYGVTAATTAGYVVTWAPFLDQYCWSDCTANAFLIRPDARVSRMFEDGQSVATIGIGLLGFVAAAAWLVRASPVARAIGAGVAAPAGTASLIEAANAGAHLVHRPEWSHLPLFTDLFLARATVLVVLAAGIGRLVWRRRRRTAGLLALVRQLDLPVDAGSLQTRLSRSLGDPTLTVAYWLTEGARYVDENGHEVHPHGATTTVVRDGARLAVLTHEQGILDDHARQRIGSAALLAIDNERLNAELRAHLEDLRASQRRIVATADETRRRLERNLHDGAQQTLLAVLYELHLARAEPGRPESERKQLTGLIDSALRSLDELRDMAHGLFPAVLEESGLEAALWSLSSSHSDPAVRIGPVPGVRLSAEAERTGYLVVTETILSYRPGAGDLTVQAGLQDGILVLQLDGPGIEPVQYLVDRVGAMDGAIVYGTGNLRAEIPCA